jgi:hypothetical protein
MYQALEGCGKSTLWQGLKVIAEYGRRVLVNVRESSPRSQGEYEGKDIAHEHGQAKR